MYTNVYLIKYELFKYQYNYLIACAIGKCII